MGFSKQGHAKQNRKDRLHNISKKYDQPRFCSQNPQGVGGTGIAAAVITDIDAVHFAINKCCLKQAKYIANQNTLQAFHFYLFSFLSRMINLRGVPLNPKASRILFSIYLV